MPKGGWHWRAEGQRLIQYETALKADSFLVMAWRTAR